MKGTGCDRRRIIKSRLLDNPYLERRISVYIDLEDTLKSLESNGFVFMISAQCEFEISEGYFKFKFKLYVKGK